MNIFYLDQDPNLCAQMMVDKHVVKMILETAQLLSTAHHVLDNSTNGELYKKTHVNHPSSKWARESRANYNWLYLHFRALLNEYQYRYGKVHASARLNVHLKDAPINIPLSEFSSPPCAMDAQYVISSDAIVNYRNYYNKGKRDLHSWKMREKPEWVTN